MSESQKLTDNTIYLYKTFKGFPETTEQLDGDYLKEYEARIQEVNNVIKKWMFLYIIMIIIVLLFSLLGFVFVIPLLIYYVIQVKNESNDVLKGNSTLLEMEVVMGLSDYIMIKKKPMV